MQRSAPAEPTVPMQEEPSEPLPQYEAPTFDEPALLAEADPSPIPQQADTTVIEYINITIFPTDQPLVEVVPVAYVPTVGDRIRTFRSRISNTFRDQACQTYAEARAELLTRINY